ncbi:MAG: FAD-dependent oxidoreductase [Saprospiraceae bacterium]|nr:tryptophan 7-halogenase [Bacteroidia bacterium]NNL93267.1 FAD-dependent oxidoreductase [Saprospiraceae bacterium]
MSNDLYSDIIVIGGGPAGSTVATKLVRQGFSVRLFEKEKFPRPHVGESLLPFCYPIFEDLGVLDILKKKFVRKPGACFVNQDGQDEMNYCFNKVIDEEMSLSFHVRRDEFDQILLDNSKANGVDVYEEHRVVKTKIDEGGCTVSVADKSGSQAIYNTKFIVDASGRDCLMAKANKTLEPIEDMDRVAVSVHWKCKEIPIALRSGSVRITYLDGDNRKGWIWCIPISPSRVSMGVVVDSQYYKSAIKDLRKQSSDWQKAYYLNELQSSLSISNIMAEMEIDGDLVVNGNYSYKSTQKYGDQFALVGDSAQFIDPIFASGVYIAMKSASLVADGIVEKINDNQSSKLEKAYEIINNGYAVVHNLIKLYYNPSILNFADSNLFGQNKGSQFSEHNHSFALIHLLLAGDFFEKGDVYLPFLESLKNESQLNRWKNLIGWDKHVSKDHHDDQDCGKTFEQIFNLANLQ